MDNIDDLVIRAYALENALKHKGKAAQGSVLAGLFAEGLRKDQVKDYVPRIKKVIEEINSMNLEEQKGEFDRLSDKVSKREIRVGLPELSNVEEGRIVTRFAPFPSGPLHIGNARPLILNDEYAKKYKGKMLLVMDDTIGSEEKPIEPDAYSLIEEGVKWLKAKYDPKILYKSERIPKYYEYAEELIKKGYLYVCNCTKDQIRDLRIKGVECSCRQFSSEEQFKRWQSMFSAKEGTMCVRLKTDMGDSDPAFRDRVMFRISERPHPRLGTKYRIYPLLDFSWAIDDHIFGITHIIRGTELAIETRVEKFIWDIFGWKHKEVVYNGHFEIEGVKISKSKSREEVKSGEYLGWNDPRTWSLQSLRDRGFAPEAIREFILGMGLTRANITTPVEVLYTINRKHLEEVPRYFFVENPVKIKIGGAPPMDAKIPMHPAGKLEEKEYKTNQEFLVSETDFDLFRNGNYRLMHLFNFKSDKLFPTRPREFSYLSTEPDKELKAKFLHWLPANLENVKVEVIMDDGSRVKGLGEGEMKKLLVGSVVQFERFGFARLHKKEDDGTFIFMFAHR